MSAVQIPEEFTVSFLRHIGTYYACMHSYIPVSTLLQDNDAAEQIAADRLRVFQRKYETKGNAIA